MVERGGRTSFPMESLERFAIVMEIFRKELECNRAPEAHIVAAVDDTHASPTEAFEYLVVGDLLADHSTPLGSGESNPSRRIMPLEAAFRQWRPGRRLCEGPTTSEPRVC